MPPFPETATLQTLTRDAQSNFFSSFFFLPKEKRKALKVVYAFCRHVDDLVDSDPKNAAPALHWWRREIAQIASGKAANAVSRELAAVIQLYQIPAQYFEDLLTGVEMDLHQNRYATFDELYEYCYRVASVVGLISLHIFGARRQESHFYAVNLGLALQLTNILRDIGDDFSRGRVYLPQDEMKRFGYTERDLHHRTYNAQFIRLMEFQVDRARQYYRRAEGFSYTSDWKNLVAAQIMGATYSALLNQIVENDYAVFEKEIVLSPARKLRIAWATYLKNRFASLSGVGRE